MDAALAAAEAAKAQGNQHFVAKRYSEALACYGQAVGVLTRADAALAAHDPTVSQPRLESLVADVGRLVKDGGVSAQPPGPGRSLLAVALSNGAQCQLVDAAARQARKGRAAASQAYVAAGAWAFAALSADPSAVKAWFRCATALERLGLDGLAHGVASRALESHSEHVELRDLCDRLAPAPAPAPVPAPAPAPASSPPRLEVTPSTLAAHDNRIRGELATVRMANSMAAMVASGKGKIAARARATGAAGMLHEVDERVAPVHEEVAAVWEAVMPRACDEDRAACLTQLELLYETARGIRSHEVALFKTWPDDAVLRQEDLLAKRGLAQSAVWGEDEMDATMDWYARGVGPRVRFLPRGPYGLWRMGRGGLPESVRDADGGISRFHSFGNAPMRTEVLTLGTAHVAVGFTDLGSLLMAELTSRKGKTGALAWHGFEVSTHAIAKTAVIERMLRRDAPGTVSHVMQAWFSSLWTDAAEAAWRSAAAAVMAEGGPGGLPLPASAHALVVHWATGPRVSAQHAVRDVRMRHEPAGAYVAGFKEGADRVALAAYFLSGALPLAALAPYRAPGGGAASGDASYTCGSAAMFALPASSPPFERVGSENFLHTIPSETLFQFRLAGGPGARDIVSAGASLLAARVALLQQRMHKGEVVVAGLHLGAVEPAATATIATIHSLQPWTIVSGIAGV